MCVAIIIFEFHLIEIMLSNVSRLSSNFFLVGCFIFGSWQHLIVDEKIFYDLE